MLKHLPNALTLLRLILAPVIAWAVWESYVDPVDPADPPAVIAAVLFAIAALTDLFDGMAARMLKAESKFGRVMDPIADKALVGLPLIALAWQLLDKGSPFWLPAAICTIVIVGRDILMTALRLRSVDGEGIRVSTLAKWKTALELTVVGLAIFVRVTPISLTLNAAAVGIWLALLIIAALLSAWTALQYLTAKPAKSSEPTPKT